MKNCDPPTLTLLVSGLLDESEAKATRAHLETCSTCRAQVEQLQRLCDRLGEPVAHVASLTPPAQLHQAFQARLRGANPEVEPGFWSLLWVRPGKFVVLGSAMAVAVLVLWLRVVSRPEPETGKIVPDAVPVAGLVSSRFDLAENSTAWAYQRAMNQSWEALEALLDQNARQGTPSATTLVAAHAGGGR